MTISQRAPLLPLKRLSAIRSSNVDKVVEDNEIPIRLCNYVDVYYNDQIHPALEFAAGSAKQSEIDRFGLRPGDVLITKDSETPDDIAVPALVVQGADDLVCGYHLALLRPNPSRLNGTFLFYALKSRPLQVAFSVLAQGITRFGLTLNGIGSVPVPLPDLLTQKAIAEFLDRETARIDQLIEKKQRMVSLLSSRWESLFHVGRRDASTEHIRFKFIATRSQRQIRLDGVDEFTPLGLYNRGRGYFKKDITPSQELGDSTFFLVREGDLILSGQFAWEGAVALADEDANGCVVSHRYPVYVGTRGVLTAYLYAYFRTADGQFMLDNCSRGAAGRNRPLNTNILEREKILLLPRRIQEKVARLVGQEQAVKKVVTTSLDRLREFRSALITAAVTGQIDVSTWGKQGTTERRLDQIEEAAST